MRRISLITFFIILCVVAVSQSDDALKKELSDMLESVAGNQLVEEDYEELLEDLIDLSYNPINLNSTTKEELERILFLTDYEIENVLYYVYVNGPLLTVYELQAVEGLSIDKARYLSHFIYVGERDFKRKQNALAGRILTRYESRFQDAEGYLAPSDSSVSSYAGGKDKFLMKSQININNSFEAGYTLEKDPGEVYFPGGGQLMDFASGYIKIRKPLKYINAIYLGDYKLSFGQGLGVWTGMTFSKTPNVSQLRRRSKGIVKYTSANESSFLRGFGMDCRYKKLSLIPFVSYKKRDASLIVDSNSGSSIVSSLKEDGYHRTNSELANRNSVSEFTVGARVAYKHHLFRVESGFVNWRLNYPLLSKEHLKDMYRFDGDNQWSSWVAYSLFLSRLTLFGELAVQQSRYPGIYQGLTYKAESDVVISLAYRYYDVQYNAILSNPFSESSIVNGESGVFASLQFSPSYRIKISAYADVFRYKWLRYRLYAPSQGFEAFVQLNYKLNQRCNLLFRYKTTQKAINSDMELNSYSIGAYQKDNLRVNYVFSPTGKLKLQGQVEHSFYKSEDDKNSQGWLFYQDFRSHLTERLTLGLRYVYFDVEDYDSRIYMYEPDVLYAFTIPSFMDQGSKVIINTKWEVYKKLVFWWRFSHTYYRNKNELGSGLNRIQGNQKTEWKFQLQYRF